KNRSRMPSSHLMASSTRIGACASTMRSDRLRITSWYCSLCFTAMSGSFQSAASLLRTHVREQDDVTDRRRVGQQHHQTVNADALTGGRRHAVFQRPNEVRIKVHGLVIAGVLLRHLGVEAL